MTLRENSSHADREQSSARKFGILIVDDEAGVRAVLDFAMRFEGFSVWLTASGHEALDLYRQDHPFIDLVLMDVRMPGLDGPQALAALRAVNPHVRCCFISGDFGKYSEGDLRSMGAAAVLYKPFHLSDVVGVVRNLMPAAAAMPAAGANELVSGTFALNGTANA